MKWAFDTPTLLLASDAMGNSSDLFYEWKVFEGTDLAPGGLFSFAQTFIVFLLAFLTSGKFEMEVYSEAIKGIELRSISVQTASVS